MSPCPCPTTSRGPWPRPPCRPGLEAPHAGLHPRQEAETLAGDAGEEAAVQGELHPGTVLGPAPLQLLPAGLL